MNRRDFALFVCAPFVFTLAALMIFRSTHLFAVNFHHEFWPAGHRVLRGLSPYVLDRRDIANGRAFPYPAVAAVLLAPLALIPRAVGDVAFTGACMLAAPATLRVLGVRDRRLYGLVLLWAPVLVAWQTANLSLPLCLALALLWRHRDRPGVAGLIAAVMVSVKPFVWPVGLWLLATRRWRAAAWAVGSGAVINALAWGTIGFSQVDRYLKDAGKVSSYFYRQGYTVVALAVHAGASRTAATVLTVVLAAAVAAAAIAVARRGEDMRSLVLCVALTLLATPVQWMHYYVLILVPLALARPRLHWSWWLPVALLPVSSSNPAPWQMVPTLLAITVMVASMLRPTGAASQARRRPRRTKAAAEVPGAA
jgi:alpha-1,2-mannosyltransferase